MKHSWVLILELGHMSPGPFVATGTKKPLHKSATLLGNLARAVFGARAIHSMKSLLGFDEVKAAADTLNLKQRELED